MAANGDHNHVLAEPPLWIVGLGAQYPPYIFGPEKLEQMVAKFHDPESAAFKKLLAVNRSSGIETRALVRPYDKGFTNLTAPPTISELDTFYRQAGVDLTVQACRKALKEWGGSYQDITHTVAVTCTNAGNPGYDLLVTQKLGLRSDLDHMLLHGVGCAGGLAIIRAAAQILNGASLRKKPARVLAFACELCSPNVRCDLADVAGTRNIDEINIAGALFGDGAAAVVLCNDFAKNTEDQAIFRLVDWANGTIPGTYSHMGFLIDPTGFRTVLSKDVPTFTKNAIKPVFERLLPSFSERTNQSGLGALDFDWALHPGGTAIIDGAQDSMNLSNDQLRATKEIYKTRGNSSSPTVLIVLDKLRTMGAGRDNVVATSFGPGLAIEMAMMQRVRSSSDEEFGDV